uniref:MIF4G domain-containing protein n=1 Tax=Microcebus murinus TaxID=30608 RepID=A0A8C5VPU2_MICMU
VSDGQESRRAKEAWRAPSGAQDKIPQQNSELAIAKPQVVVAPVLVSKLSVHAPEFYPSGYYSNYTESYEDGCEDYPTPSEYAQDFLNHLTEQPGSFETEIEQFAETLNGWKLQQMMLCKNLWNSSINRPHLSQISLTWEVACVIYLSHHLTISPQSELLNALFSNPMDDNLICAVKLLKLTGSVLEDAWKEKGKTDMQEIIQRIENVVLDANCSRDVKQVLKLVELPSSNWGRVRATSTYREATPENDPNYFMNEPTFYTSDGVPFTASDPDYQEKYQELLEREDFFPYYEENRTALSGSGDPYLDDIDDEMDPEIEEAYEKFCLESEHKRKQ